MPKLVGNRSRESFFCDRLLLTHSATFITPVLPFVIVSISGEVVLRPTPWASAHRGKWGQLTPLENG